MRFEIWASKAVSTHFTSRKLFSNGTNGTCLLYLATPKALRTSAHPGLTQALSTRLKLSLEPLVYAFDTPGVMLPFLGLGQEGAERGVKLALIGT